MRAFLIFLFALAVRAATAIWVSQPGYMDSYYYYAIGESLYRGNGFVENFVWNYLSIPSTIPHPSNLYWMPLPSVALALSFFVLGESFRAAQVPMVIVSAILPAISYVVTKDILANERYAVSAAIFTVFSAPYMVFWTVPESFGLFAVFGSLTLYFTYKGLRGNSWYFAAAGATCGLAHLTRADGALLFLIVLAMAGLSTAMNRLAQAAGAALWSILAPVAAYLVILSPWLCRNYLATGSPFPSSGLKAAFLREYNDMFAYGHSVDLSYYFQSGWENILQSKASALALNLATYDYIALIYMLPFSLIGWWQLRRRVELLPILLYALGLYVLASLVFTYPGPRGLLLHSGTALLPFLFGPAVAGLDCTVEYVSRYRRHWSIPTAQLNFTRISLGFSVALSLVIATRALATWDDQYRLYQQIASLTEQRVLPTQTVMVVDPPAYYYVTKRPSIVFANDGVAQLAALSQRFHVAYVVLEPAHPQALRDLYTGRESSPALELEQTFPDKDGRLVKLYRVVPFSQ